MDDIIAACFKPPLRGGGNTRELETYLEIVANEVEAALLGVLPAYRSFVSALRAAMKSLGWPAFVVLDATHIVSRWMDLGGWYALGQPPRMTLQSLHDDFPQSRRRPVAGTLSP